MYSSHSLRNSWQRKKYKKYIDKEISLEFISKMDALMYPIHKKKQGSETS